MMLARITSGLGISVIGAAVSLSIGCGNGTTGAAGTSDTAGMAGASGSSGGDASGAAGQSGLAAEGGADASVTAAPCSPPVNRDQPIMKLSQTGCMDPKDPTKMASIVIPYEVNSPLWSDNADKSRGMVIPAGKKIHTKDCASAPAECPQGPEDTGKWVMPVGTVMVKNFMFDGKLVETRLLTHPDGNTWAGYSYRWDEAQTEATVLPDDRLEIMFNTGQRTVDWHFPNRFDCNGCHTQQAGGTLGPETRQMNRTVSGMNQIDRWKALNLFDDTAPKAPYQAALVLPYAGQLGAVPAGAKLDDRARSYLHANCAYCHRPDGDFNMIDFRFDTAFKDMGACGVTPSKGDVGVVGSQVLKPGTPMESAMWLRMNAPPSSGKTRMPQLATYVVDDQGLKLMGDWITSITACTP